MSRRDREARERWLRRISGGPSPSRGAASGSAKIIDQRQPVPVGTATKTPRSSRRGDNNVGAHVERTLGAAGKSEARKAAKNAKRREQ